MTTDSVLHLIAGPNGAGKSTFYARVLEPVTNLSFVNADQIAHTRWPGDESAHAYEASRAASELRTQLISDRRSFVTETVFSHGSKLDFCKYVTDAGYLVSLHVIVIPVELAVARVMNRVDLGGHSVPEEKIRDRYDRLWALVRSAADVVDHTLIYDNTKARNPFRIIARFEQGQLFGDADWPTWTPAALQR